MGLSGERTGAKQTTCLRFQASLLQGPRESVRSQRRSGATCDPSDQYLATPAGEVAVLSS